MLTLADKLLEKIERHAPYLALAIYAVMGLLDPPSPEMREILRQASREERLRRRRLGSKS